MKILSNKFYRLLRFPLGLVGIAFVAAILFWPIVSGKAAEPKVSEQQKASAPPSSPTIPLADVATRAMEVSNIISNISMKSASSPEIERIQNELPGVGDNINLALSETTKIIQRQPSLATLQNQQQLWQATLKQTSGWLKVLTH